MPRLEPSAGPIRVVIADDHGLVREGLRAVLATDTRIRVVGSAADGESAIRMTLDLAPDVLLLDVSMPRLDGFAVLQQLRERHATTRVILVTAELSPEKITKALLTGARGLFLKASAPELLAKCVHAVAAGEYWVRREVLGDLVRQLVANASSGDVGSRTFGLSKREREIMELVVAGYSNKEIAERCGLSPDTVKHHVSSIFDKTGVSSRLELARFADHFRLADGPPE